MAGMTNAMGDVCNVCVTEFAQKKAGKQFKSELFPGFFCGLFIDRLSIY